MIPRGAGPHLLQHIVQAPTAMVLKAAPDRLNLGTIISNKLMHKHKRNIMSKQK
jgi:hypothetical protein